MWPTVVIIFLAAVTVASCQQTPPAPMDPKVDALANSIYNGLMSSPVLKKALPFKVPNPYDVYYRVSSRLLKKFGLVDPTLAEVAAAATQKVGVMTSDLCIRTVAYELAKYLNSYRYLTDENVPYFSFMYVTSVELAACRNGVHDGETVSNALVYGLYDILNLLDLTTYEEVSNLYHVFAHELLKQAGKSESVELVYDLKIPITLSS